MNSLPNNPRPITDFGLICKLCNEAKTFNDILHKEFCPLAFQSVYPYMITLLNGGWFNWVGHDKDVIVNCPSPQGVAMSVKAPAKDSPNLIEVEIIERNTNCFKQYKLKDAFIFDFNDKNRFNFETVYNTIPFAFTRGESRNYV